MGHIREYTMQEIKYPLGLHQFNVVSQRFLPCNSEEHGGIAYWTYRGAERLYPPFQYHMLVIGQKQHSQFSASRVKDKRSFGRIMYLTGIPDTGQEKDCFDQFWHKCVSTLELIPDADATPRVLDFGVLFGHSSILTRRMFDHDVGVVVLGISRNTARRCVAADSPPAYPERQSDENGMEREAARTESLNSWTATSSGCRHWFGSL